MATDNSLAARAAWLSYVGGLTQSEVAKRLDVSSTKAHRLIGQAQKAGLVRVFIDEVPAECVELEEFIASHFSLNTCTVAPDIDDSIHEDPSRAFNAVGVAAARRLHAMLISAEGQILIGVGKGRSLTAMVRSLPKMQRPDSRFVAVSGSLTRNLSANPYDVVHNLVERTGGEGFFLPVPYIASSIEEQKLLKAQKSVQDMISLGREADAYVIGIGAIGDDALVNAHIRETRMVSEDEWRELRNKMAVCDIMGSFVDINGSSVDSYINKLALGLGLDEVSGRKVMAVVGGHGKDVAVLAALRTGVITDLVVSEEIANGLKKLLLKEAA